MSDKTWKQFERTVAGDFNTTRNPLSSRHSKHGTESDSLHPRLYIEAKRDRSMLGAALLSVIEDTVACATKEKKLPVIAIKDHGKKGYYVLCRARDLTRIAEEMKQ